MSTAKVALPLRPIGTLECRIGTLNEFGNFTLVDEIGTIDVLGVELDVCGHIDGLGFELRLPDKDLSLRCRVETLVHVAAQLLVAEAKLRGKLP